MLNRPALAAVVLALSSAFASGADFNALKPTGYVNDFAGVVSAADKVQLERYAKSLEDQTGVQIALVTVPTLDGEPIEDVANLLYRRWGIGNKKSNEGALVLLAIRDRRSRVEVGYGLEPMVPDGFAGSVLRGMRPSLREGDYGGALAQAAREIGERAARAKNVKLTEAPPKRAKQQPKGEFPVGLVIGFFVLVLLLGLSSRGRRGGPRGGSGRGGDFLTGVLLGSVLGGGSSSRSSGGFGGFDSGDSFGGFGGGDSGGGGASGSW